MATTRKIHQSIDGPIALVALLKFCAEQKDLQRGSRIHADIIATDLLEQNVFVGSALVNMYAKCGALVQAQEVFDALPIRNVVSWNALIAGYTQNEEGKKALNCFGRMQVESISPHPFTLACILKACGCTCVAHKGRHIHAIVVERGLLQKDIVLRTSLLDMYAKCGLLGEAQEVFYELPIQNVVAWNALITGYAQQGHGEEALDCYEQMRRRGIFPNAITLSSILKACGSIGAIDMAPEIHAHIVRNGLIEKDIVVANALIDMYAKCGALEKAQDVFDKLQVRNVVSWNTMIAGYAQHGYDEEALHCFEQMQGEGFSSGNIPFACILRICGNMGAAGKGQEVHFHAGRDGLLEKDVVVGTALIDMYAKCGILDKAQEIFDELSVRNLASWNALISGYAQLGEDEFVFKLFDQMTGEGEEPNVVTFTSVLNVCSHRGVPDKGQLFFEAMSVYYGIFPTLEHHTCMVDLFGRAGLFNKMVALIKEMPFSANLTTWHTLLGACQKWGNVKLGRWAFKQAVQLDENDVAAYVGMRNIYASAGMQENVAKIETTRVERQLWALSSD